MQEQYSASSCTPLRTTERYITLSTHPFDPPSSPPPTSPLPPLPEIASYRHGTPTSSLAEMQPVLTKNQPSRPPRPQTSLPNLAPRTITSPEPATWQRHSAVPINMESALRYPSRRQKNTHTELRILTLPKRRQPDRFFGRIFTSSSRFSNEASSILSKFWVNVPSCHRPSNGMEVSTEVTKTDALRSVHVLPFYRIDRQVMFVYQSLTAGLRTRSIPSVSGSRSERMCRPHLSNIAERIEAAEICGSSCALADVARSPSNLDDKSIPEAPQAAWPQIFHRRSPAVSSFTFNFDDAINPTKLPADEDLTSLPKITSDSVLLANTAIGKTSRDRKAFPKNLVEGCRHEGTFRFASLPYAHTLQLAGPKPKTQRHNAMTSGTHCNAELADGVLEQLTEEDIRHRLRKRILWAAATAALVVIATAGILIGIIWKLRTLT